MRSDDGAREAMIDQDPSGTLRFVREGAVGGGLGARRSFVSRAPQDLRYSADGRWLYFFAQDPLSGYLQMFRVAADR